MARNIEDLFGPGADAVARPRAARPTTDTDTQDDDQEYDRIRGRRPFFNYERLRGLFNYSAFGRPPQEDPQATPQPAPEATPQADPQATAPDLEHRTQGATPLDDFRERHPTKYQKLKSFAWGAAKTLGIGTGSLIAGSYVNEFASYIPLVGEQLGNIAGPSSTGILHWNLSNFAFGNGFMNKGFDFANKWMATSVGIAGVINGTVGALGYGIDTLTLNSFDITAFTDYLSIMGNNIFNTTVAAGIAAASAFGGLNLFKTAYNNAGLVTLLGVSYLSAAGLDGQLSSMGMDPATADLTAKGIGTSILYLGSGLFDGPKKWIPKIGAGVYAIFLFAQLGIPDAAANGTADLVSNLTFNTNIIDNTRSVFKGLSYALPVALLEGINYLGKPSEN